MRVLAYLLVVIIPVVIILGNFRYLIFNSQFYQSLYKKVGVYQSFVDTTMVDSATINLLGYFRGKNELDHNFFSNQAQLHLYDVKKLLNLTTSFFIINLLVTLALSMSLILKKHYASLIFALSTASVATIVSIGILSIGLLAQFDFLFLKFHQFLFNDNLWQFPPDDNLIKLFPPQFFVIFANKLVVNMLITSVVIALCALVISKKLRLKL